MSSKYPKQKDLFTVKHDATSQEDPSGDYIMAEDINDVQDAIGTIQDALGLNPQGNSGTVAERIAKAESSTPLRLPSILVYLGDPTAINQAAGSIDRVVETFLGYDHIVLGYGAETTSNSAHNFVINAIQTVKQSRQVNFYGYLDCGVTTANLSLSELQVKIQSWFSMGAVGIFCDNIGYNNGVGRERQNAILDSIHQNGMVAVLTASSPDDIFSFSPNATYNPNQIKSNVKKGDIYFYSSFVVDTSAQSPHINSSTIEAKMANLLSYRKDLGIRLFGGPLIQSTVSDTLAQQYYEYGHAWAILYSLDAYHPYMEGFSAASNMAKRYKEIPLIGNWYNSNPKIDKIDSPLSYKRKTGFGDVEIDPTNHTYQYNGIQIPVSFLDLNYLQDGTRLIQAINSSVSSDRIDLSKVMELSSFDGSKITGSLPQSVLAANVVEAINLYAGNAVIGQARIGNLDADKITAGTISADRITSSVIGAINAYIGDAVIGQAKIGDLDAGKIMTGDLAAERIQTGVINAINAHIGSAVIDQAKIGNLSADKITAGSISADRMRANIIQAVNLYAQNMAVGDAVINTAAIGVLTAGHIKASVVDAINLNTTLAKIDAAQISALTAAHIQAVVIDAVNANITNAKIDAAHIGALSAENIKAAVVEAINLKATNAVIDAARVGVLTADHIKAAVVEAINLNAASAKIDVAHIGALGADHMLGAVIDAINLTTQTATINAARIGALTAEHIKAAVVEAINLNATNAVIDMAKIGDLDASKITAGTINVNRLKGSVVDAINLSASTAFIEGAKINSLNASQITAGDILADRMKATVVNAINAYAQTITAGQATINAAAIGSLKAENIQAEIIKAVNASIETAKIKAAAIDVLTADHIKTAVIDAVNAYVGIAVIDQAKIGDLNASKITAGDINTARLKANVVSAINADLTSATINAAKIGQLDAEHIKVAVIEAINASIETATINAAKIGSLKAENIQTEVLKAINASVETATINAAKISALTVNHIQAAVVDAINANVGTATINAGRIGALTTDNMKGTVVEAINAYIGSAVINSAKIADLNASKIVAGSIAADRMSVNVVQAINADLSSATIGSAKIGSLTADKIQAAVVEAINARLDTATINAAKIGELTADHIKATVIEAVNGRLDTAVINAAKIGILTVDHIKATVVEAINLNATTAVIDQAKIGNLNASKITAGDIAADRLKANAISAVNADLSGATIGAAKIGVLEAGNIKAGSIDATKLVANTITATQIAAGTITSTEIAAGAIKTTQLDAEAVTAGKIAAGAISATHIAADTITSAQIAAGAITATEIASDAILAQHIKAGEIDATKIKTNTITASQIAADTITAAQIATGAITANELAANSVTASAIRAGEIQSTHIGAGQIKAGNIEAGAITTEKITAGSINGDRITAGTINGDRLIARSIDADRIRAGSITGVEISVGTVNADRLISGSVTATQLSAGSITSDHITTGGLDAQIVTVYDGASGEVLIGGGFIRVNGLDAGVVQSDNLAANGLFMTASSSYGIRRENPLGEAIIGTGNEAPGGNQIWKIDLATGTLVDTINIPAKKPAFMAIDDTVLANGNIGKYGYVSVQGDDTLIQIDLEYGTIDATKTLKLGKGPGRIKYTGGTLGDMKHFFVVNTDKNDINAPDSFYVIDAPPHSEDKNMDGIPDLYVHHQLIMGNTPYDFVLDPITKLTYVTLADQGDILIVDTNMFPTMNFKTIGAIPISAYLTDNYHGGVDGGYGLGLVEGGGSSINYQKDAGPGGTAHAGHVHGGYGNSDGTLKEYKPHGLALSTDAAFLYVADNANGELVVINRFAGNAPAPEHYSYIENEVLLEKINKNYAAYVDPDAAIADGYIPASPFVPYMGYHFSNKTMGYNPEKPNTLCYVYDTMLKRYIISAAEWVTTDPTVAPPATGPEWMMAVPAMAYYIDGTTIPAESAAVAPATNPKTGSAFDHWEPALYAIHCYHAFKNPLGLFADTNPIMEPYNDSPQFPPGYENYFGLPVTVLSVPVKEPVFSIMHSGMDHTGNVAPGAMTNYIPTSNFVKTRISVGSSPEFVQVVNGKIFVTLYGSTKIAVINESDTGLGHNMDGAHAHMNMGTGDGIVPVHYIEVGAKPIDMVVDKDKTYMYVSVNGASTVVKIDLATETVVATYNSGANVMGLAITPDAKFLYAVNNGGSGSQSFVYPPGPYIGDAYIGLEGGIKFQGAQFWTPNRSDWKYDGNGNIKSYSAVEFRINEPLLNEGGYTRLATVGKEYQWASIEQDIFNVSNYSDGNGPAGSWYKTHNASTLVAIENSSSSNFTTYFQVDEFVPKFIAIDNQQTEPWTYSPIEIPAETNADYTGFEYSVNTNRAVGKIVTASANPTSGTLSLITDNAEVDAIHMMDPSAPQPATPASSQVTLPAGLQSVTIDLGKAYMIAKISVSHMYGTDRIYHNTKTEVSEDGNIWYTVYDSAVSGEYNEAPAFHSTHGHWHYAKFISFNAKPVRYVRDWANGWTSGDGLSGGTDNHWTEIKVYGDWEVEAEYFYNYALKRPQASLSTGGGVIRNIGNTADVAVPVTYGDLGAYDIGFIVDGTLDPNLYFNGGKNKTWVQVDLGQERDVDFIKVWHYFADVRTYHETKTEIGVDDGLGGITWTTVFDSAAVGSSEYQEIPGGHLIDLGGLKKVRYIRDWANGATVNGSLADPENRWLQIQAYNGYKVDYPYRFAEGSDQAGQNLATNGRTFVHTDVSGAYAAVDLEIDFTSWWWMTYIKGPQFGQLAVEMPTVMGGNHFLQQDYTFLTKEAHRHIMSFPPSVSVKADDTKSIKAGKHRAVVKQVSGRVSLDRLRFEDYQKYMDTKTVIPYNASKTFVRYKISPEHAKAYQGSGNQSTDGAYDTVRINPHTKRPDRSVPIKYRIKLKAELNAIGTINERGIAYVTSAIFETGKNSTHWRRSEASDMIPGSRIEPWDGTQPHTTGIQWFNLANGSVRGTKIIPHAIMDYHISPYARIPEFKLSLNHPTHRHGFYKKTSRGVEYFVDNKDILDSIEGWGNNGVSVKIARDDHLHDDKYMKLSGGTLSGTITATTVVGTNESHFSNGTFVDPHVNTAYGIKVSQGIASDRLYVTGNITVDGTVDGRDLSVDGAKLDAIAAGATKTEGSITNGNIKVNGTEVTVYTHPTGDGNTHVPANGTSNSSKVLKATAIAGSYGWGNVAWGELTGVPTTFAPPVATGSNLGGVKQGSNVTIAADGTISVAAPYSHPIGDGNLHVPATGTVNNGMVLKAGATAGSLSWGTLSWTDITGKPTTFTPSAHQHGIVDITDLNLNFYNKTEVDNKMATAGSVTASGNNILTGMNTFTKFDGPAIKIQPSTVPAANTVLFQMLSTSGANLITFDAEGDVTINANLTVQGTTTYSGTNTVTGSYSISDNLTVGGNATLGDAVTDQTTVKGELRVEGPIKQIGKYVEVHRRPIFGIAGDGQFQTDSTDFETIVSDIYTPTAYALPGIAAGAVRYYRIYTVHSDDITTPQKDAGQMPILRLAGDTIKDLTMEATWGNPNARRDWFSPYFADAPTGHWVIQAKLAQAGNQLGIRWIELIAYDVY